MSEGGYIRLWRKARKNGWMRNHLLWAFWTWLLTGAAYKTHTTTFGFQRVKLEPGQILITIPMACYEIGANPRQIRTCIEALKNFENITVKTTNKFSIVSIVNWAAYQSDENSTDRQTDRQPTVKRQTTDTPLIVEKGKEGKEGKEDIQESDAASPPPPTPVKFVLGIAKTKTAKQIPEDLAITTEMIDHATMKGVHDIQASFEKFKAYHSHKGDRGLSWGQSWITWCGNEIKFGNNGGRHERFQGTLGRGEGSSRGKVVGIQAEPGKYDGIDIEVDLTKPA